MAWRRHLTVNHDFYEFGSIPLTEIFQDLAKSLADEIKITNEQTNFIRAREYYRGSTEGRRSGDISHLNQPRHVHGTNRW